MVLVVAGVVLVLAGALMRLPGWRPLPGDVRGRRGNVVFVAPLGTGVLISLLLTVALNAALCGIAR